MTRRSVAQLINIKHPSSFRFTFLNLNAIIYKMSFIRRLDKKQIAALYSNKNSHIFNLLMNDIKSGFVFPALRKNEIYFYYDGGCLYKFANGCFVRDKAYEKYDRTVKGLSSYETAKNQIESKFTNTKGNDKERRLLNALYCHTYCREKELNTVVLDIEVNLNGNTAKGKKCDMVLYNTHSRELMFVEGKVFYDRRVNVKQGHAPKVIEQVNAYSAAIAEQKETIINQYENYIVIINSLFGTTYQKPDKLVPTAKLLVYETPLLLNNNNKYSLDTITTALGKNDVVWFEQNERPSTDEIWNTLCK